VGRKKEIINRGGEKISPYEIEKAVLAHPAVREAAAFSVPHPRLGENPAVAVVLTPGSTLTPPELREFLSGKLTWFKIPRRIAVLARLPKSITGKIQRSQLTKDSLGKSDPGAVPVTRLHAELLELWCTFLKTADLSIDDDFFDKGGDSLLAIRLLLEVERLTGRALPESILFEASTIRQLADRLSGDTSLQPNPVIEVSSGERQSPLLFFHGDFNFGGYYVKNLARIFGPELPIIAIAPHGIGDEPIPQSIADMASDRLSAVLKVQPQGPYRLVGHCNGALVAFETARLLLAAEHTVQFVAMIDAPTVTLRRRTRNLLSTLIWILGPAGVRRDPGASVLAWTWQKLVAYERFSTLSWARQLAQVRGWIRGIAVGSPREPVAIPETENQFELAKSRDRRRKYASAMAIYFPAPLAVPIVYFSSENNGQPWARISPDLELIDVPGGHYDWVTIRAQRLARRLLPRIQGARAMAQVTNIRELPLLHQWDVFDGLHAEVIEGTSVVGGQQILRLAAVGDGRHALGARFCGLVPGGKYRAITWIKTEPDTQVMIEARDSIDPHTGKPSNYGVARFDLATRSIVNVTGDILNSGMEAAEDGWQKISVELRSRDGHVFVLLALVEGNRGGHVFKERGQEVTFGGFDIYDVRQHIRRHADVQPRRAQHKGWANRHPSVPDSSAKGSGAAGTAASALRISARPSKARTMVRKTIESEWCDGKREDELADQISEQPTRKSASLQSKEHP
jgi:pimeloyl-ACP methyl ester carboxylesterase